MPEVAAAPAPPQVSDSNPRMMDEIGANIAREAIAQTLKEQTPSPADGRPRGTDGKFLPAEGKPADEIPAGEIPPVEGEQPSPAEAVTEIGEDGQELVEFELPEGLVDIPTITGRQPAAEFKVMDHEGELEVPDLTFTFKANGRERTEPIDRMVRLAQMGVYNEQREEEVKTTRSQIAETQQQAQQVWNYAKQLEQKMQAVLSDDNAYLAERAAWQRQNTPEARAQLQMQQVEHQRAANEFESAKMQGQTFFQSDIVPAVEQVTTALPLVSPEEIGAKMILISRGLEVKTAFGDILPPSRYGQFNQAFLNELIPWAKQLQDHREQERSASTRHAEADKKKAQIEAQRAKNLVGRQTSPSRRSASGTQTGRGAAPPIIKTVEDAEKAVLRATMSSMGVGSE